MVRRTTKMLKKLNKNGVKFDSKKKKLFTSSKRKPISEMDCYNCGELGHLAHQCPKPKKDKFKKKYKDNKDDSSDDEKKREKPYKKKDGKKKQYHKKKNGKAYIVGDGLTDIESSSGSSGEDIDDEKERVAALVIGSSLPPPPHHHHPLHTYDSWPRVTGSYTKIIRKTRAKNDKLELEKESLLAKYEMAQKASDELRDENKVVSSSLKELKANIKELKQNHDKLEEIHKELNTTYDLLKDDYTTLKVNHDNLVIADEYLYNEPHDATNLVAKIDIATSYDDLIDEYVEQGSSGKGKQVVVAEHYDDYVKIKNENEKLKKDLEKLSTTNSIVIETQDGDYNMAIDIEKLQEENKKLKIEKTHLATGFEKFTRGHNLQSELLMNTVMKNDKSGIGYKANQMKKAKAQYQAQHQHKSKPKPKRYGEMYYGYCKNYFYPAMGDEE
ncbi:uncharacterized protein [Miscanthus floridulus]|uniref:uncharacterized protein n=1 Tax=Miscanthus floridulus TaxID=154761 RepID=UPI00345A27CE